MLSQLVQLVERGGPVFFLVALLTFALWLLLLERMVYFQRSLVGDLDHYKKVWQKRGIVNHVVRSRFAALCFPP